MLHSPYFEVLDLFPCYFFPGCFKNQMHLLHKEKQVLESFYHDSKQGIWLCLVVYRYDHAMNLGCWDWSADRQSYRPASLDQLLAVFMWRSVLALLLYDFFAHFPRSILYKFCFRTLWRRAYAYIFLTASRKSWAIGNVLHDSCTR